MTGRNNRLAAGRKHGRGLTAVLLAGLMAGCAAMWAGTSNRLTVFVSNFELDALVVSIAGHDGCEVGGQVIRQECRYPWAQTDGLLLLVEMPSKETTHMTRLERVSAGDRLCLMVWTSEVKLEEC
ncbi:MAG: hypothetical protein OXI71_02610 [Gemmatimonadota bacterium]|nr:hypothetical protein [Gemmatimonadota bacterium]